MKIHVKMIGPLIYDVGFSEKDLDIPARTTAERLLELISVPKQRPRIVTRNGKSRRSARRAGGWRQDRRLADLLRRLTIDNWGQTYSLRSLPERIACDA